MALRVLEIFDSFQGEGYWTGTPMTFVRLAGCNAPELSLDCTRWCDTRESWSIDLGEEQQVGEVLLQVRLPHVCLTGGEPLLQRDEVALFAAEARVVGMQVHIETNGTIAPPVVARSVTAGSSGKGRVAVASRALVPGGTEGRVFDWATVSPKPPDYDVDPGWDGLVDELKLIVDDRLTAGTAERLAAAHPEAVVSIQPVWGAHAAEEHGTAVLGPGWGATQRAMAMVMDHPEWRLSLQMHKFLGIR
jgi:7-carboxy-7-deazaguanine synthase